MQYKHMLEHIRGVNMTTSKNHNIKYYILSIIIVLFFVISCEKNPVCTGKDSEIVFDYMDFGIEITDKTDSMCTINLDASVIYHPENSGFQIIADGYFFYNSDRTSGFGRGSAFWRYKLSDPRLTVEGSRFINAEDIDTLLYETQYTDVEINYYTIFEYQMFGIFTDEPINSDFDTLSTKSYYYCLVDTLEY